MVGASEGGLVGMAGVGKSVGKLDSPLVGDFVGAFVGFLVGDFVGFPVGTGPDVVIVQTSCRPSTFRNASMAICRTFPNGLRLAALQVSSLPFLYGTHCHSEGKQMTITSDRLIEKLRAHHRPCSKSHSYLVH